jgi:periplasmic protein TonB
MFTNLIESDSHRKEFKRRSSFFLATISAYALILSAAGVASIYAYDAHLEAQNTDITLLSWVPPMKPVEPDRPQPTRRTPASTNTGRISPQPVRPVLYESASNPHTPPSTISVAAQPIPPAPPNTRIGNYVGDPVQPPGGSTACVACTGDGTTPVVRVNDDATPPPAPVVVKPPSTQKVSQGVLIAKAISLPQPPYPQLAKQIRIQGLVTVQILVDEQGRVLTAQPVSGHPTLLAAAKEAALRARFTPTKLSGVAVKVQGVITYNFVLQ